jgi:tRNA-specific 2-thiouridylase
LFEAATRAAAVTVQLYAALRLRCRGGGCGERDARDATAVAAQLGIQLHEIDCVSRYWEQVFTPFVQRYAAGAPANPDLGCNRYIKFGALLQAAQQLGAQAVATGEATAQVLRTL